MEIRIISEKISEQEMMPIAHQLVMYKRKIGEDVYLHRILPPIGKYFLDLAVYCDARNALTWHAFNIDQSPRRTKSLEDFFKTKDYELGFGLFQSDTRIDIFTIGDYCLRSYFEEQIRCFEFPVVEESREESLLVSDAIMEFLNSNPMSQKFFDWLSFGFPSEVQSPAYRRMLPEMLSLSPLEKSHEECLMWSLMVGKLAAPKYYDLVTGSMEDVNPFTGEKIGLTDVFYSKYLGKNTCLLESLSAIKTSLLKSFPIISSNPFK